MSQGILVFIEHRDGVVNKTSFEAIAAAQSLASQLQQPVTAVVLGSGIDALAQEIAAYDLAKVLYANNAKLADYTPDGYTDAMEQVVRSSDPQFVIMPHTYLVRDYAPKLAARFGKSLISDCVRAKVATAQSRSRAGFSSARLTLTSSPMARRRSLRRFNQAPYRGDQAVKGSGAAVETIAVEVGEIRMTPEAPFQEVKQAVDLIQGRDDRGHRPRHQEQRQHRAGRETRGSARRRSRRLAADLRRRMAAD